MDDDDLVDENSIDLDLNQEPVEPPSPSVAGVGSLMDGLETANGRMDERIRLLAGIAARARLRRGRAKSPMEISHFSNEILSIITASTRHNSFMKKDITSVFD